MMDPKKKGKTLRFGNDITDYKAHGTNMMPIWVLSAPDGPHVGPMNLAIWDRTVLSGNYTHDAPFVSFLPRLASSR